MDKEEIFGKRIKTVVLDDSPEVGIDLDDQIISELIYGDSSVDQSKIQQFTSISQRRDQLYGMIDTMCQDSQVAQALDIYVQSATERSQQGKVVWCTSEDSNIQKYVTFLLDTINVDKYIYKWVYCLAKYGDAYIRVFRESELEDDLFHKNGKDTKNVLNEDFEKFEEDYERLNEKVIIKAFKKSDKYAHYVELHSNPAEIFELTKHGKTYGYIQAPVMGHMNLNAQQDQSSIYQSELYRYNFKERDVYLLGADEFVHACLDNTEGRDKETVNISSDDENTQYEYQVKRGKSILYNAFKSWRLLNLLENSLMLNRLTKSSIVRIIGVKVGDMPKEDVQKHLYGVKSMIEQKSALNVGTSLTDYNSPGPIENYIITPIRENDQGNIMATTIGGDVDVKGLADIDYFKNKFFGALGIPKQYLGDTDDSAGFDAGKSLSLISSIFAKAVKRIQDAMIATLTDAMNLMLIDKGLISYVNKFEIKMQEPTTQEEVDRVEARANQLSQINDVMNILADVDKQSVRLNLAKTMLSKVMSDTDLIEVLQDYIEEIEETEVAPEETGEPGSEDIEMNDMDLNGMATGGAAPSLPDLGEMPERPSGGEGGGGEEPSGGGGAEPAGGDLPDIPADLDLTDNTQF